jgi:predicted 3-demethylubiquinone-9 3-methyltransferase (glyoxalase superfamily)
LSARSNINGGRGRRCRRTSAPGHLWFDTEAEQAAELYCSIFPNSRIVSVAPYTEAGPRPAGTAMTVELELDGVRMIATNGGPQFSFSEAVSLMVTCQEQDEVDH